MFKDITDVILFLLVTGIIILSLIGCWYLPDVPWAVALGLNFCLSFIYTLYLKMAFED